MWVLGESNSGLRFWTPSLASDGVETRHSTTELWTHDPDTMVGAQAKTKLLIWFALGSKYKN